VAEPRGALVGVAALRAPSSAAFRASGLPVYWARQYACLRPPEAAAAAEAHVVGTLATLPLPARLACAVALRALPAAFWLATGRPLRRASAESGAVGMARLSAIPGVGSAVRAGTALALYGALDGQPVAGRDVGGRGSGVPVAGREPDGQSDAERAVRPGPGRLAKGPA
jgi:hypothetical protein